MFKTSKRERKHLKAIEKELIERAHRYEGLANSDPKLRVFARGHASAMYESAYLVADFLKTGNLYALP